MSVQVGFRQVGHCPACEVESAEPACWMCGRAMTVGRLGPRVQPTPDQASVSVAVERRWRINLWARR